MTYDTSSFPDRQQQPLPNSTLVLVLGIISIIGCCCYGGGLILGIITLIVANKDRRLYFANPGAYTENSYSNLKAGRVCAMISIGMSALYIIMLIIAITVIGVEALTNPQSMQDIWTN